MTGRGRSSLAVARSLVVPVLLVTAAALVAGAAHAQVQAGCFELCGTSCVKPIATPDRWDDVTAIAGYDGTNKTLPNWRNDGKYDQEAFTDVNGNGLWDPGEPYIDGNRNGIHDAEAYDPLTTGYVADPTPGNALALGGDLGRSLTLEYDNQSLTAIPGLYEPIDLPPVNKGAPIAGQAAFIDNFAHCNPALVEPADLLQIEPGSMVGPANQEMRDLIAQDPGAYWDDITQTVQGSAFATSPRVILVAAWDPRIIPNPGRTSVVARKVIPLFLDHMVGNASAFVRFLRLQTTGAVCSSGSAGMWLYACATATTPATWGRVKATYR